MGAQLTTVVPELESGSASETSYGHGCLEEQFATTPRSTVSECGYHNFYSRPPQSMFNGGTQLTTVVLELASGSTSEESYGHGYLEKQFATTPKSTILEYRYHNFYSRPPELIFDGKAQLTTVVLELASSSTSKKSYGHGYLEKQFATTPKSTISEYGCHSFHSRPPELIFDGKAQLTTVVPELASGSASETSYDHGCLEEQFTTTPRYTVSECGYHNFYSRPPESIFDGGAQLTTVVLELASGSTSEKSYGHGYLEKQFATTPKSTILKYGYHNFYSRPPELIFDGKAQLTTVVLDLTSSSTSGKSYGHGYLEKQFATTPTS